MSEIRIKRNGISLFEIVVVVGIVLCLIAIAVPALRFFQRESDLNNSAEEIINTLRLAQSKTVASESFSQWGVYFSKATMPHQYTLFKGSSYAMRVASFDEIHNLPSSVEISEINLLGGGNEVVFSKVSGGAVPSGNIVTGLVSETSKTRSVYVDSAGQVSLNSPSILSDGRIQDARHVHFDLGWSIQNATTLKFLFPNIPQTETKEMVSYFNIDKTEFEWDNENDPFVFVVGGPEQVFKIHTHFLDAISTTLCIHRDRNNSKNNQEVIIYIVDGGVDKEIAHYLGDISDTVQIGLYANEMEKQ